MDRLRVALRLVLVLAACTGAAILLAGTRPASDPGLLPWLVQAAGHLCGLVAGLLVLGSRADGEAAAGARPGALLLPAVLALVLLDVVVATTSSGGAVVGAGLLRIVLFVAIGWAALQIARTLAEGRRAR
ncbi:hypothetical protein [Blastococcus sp. SYSU D00813]